MTLVLQGVTREAGGETLIHPVDLTLTRGSVNVLLGPTLAGKTSLMRLMCGLDRPSAGRILFDGRDVTGLPVKQRNVAMVYQQFINYPSLTVYENIASPMRVAGRPKAEIDREVQAAAELLKLGPHLAKTPLQLSGGQQQRTAIARALVKKADLVLLDEPLANLDYKLREELRIELPRIFESVGAIFVYATTEPAEALLLGGNTATLAEGRVTQFGPTPAVYRQPKDRRTAEVFSDPPMNFTEVTVVSGNVTLSGLSPVPALGPLATVPDGRYAIGFRPHHLLLARQKPEMLALSCQVAVAEITGSESYIHIDRGGERWIALTHGVRDYHPGAALDVFIDPRALFVFTADGRTIAAPHDYSGA